MGQHKASFGQGKSCERIELTTLGFSTFLLMRVPIYVAGVNVVSLQNLASQFGEILTDHAATTSGEIAPNTQLQ